MHAPGQTSGTVVPSTSDDKTAVYDPHDYDEVPIDEAKSPTSPPALKPEIMAKLPMPPGDRPKAPAPPGSPRPPAPYKKRPPSAPAPYRNTTGVPAPSLRNDVYSTVDEVRAGGKGGDYAEVSEVSEQEVVESVSRAKFDLIKERLKKVLVHKAYMCTLYVL